MDESKTPTNIEGGGVTLYIDENTCEKFGITPNSNIEVNEEFINGKATLRLEYSNSGISVDEMLNEAKSRSEWKISDHFESNDEECLTIRVEDKFRVTIDDCYVINGEPINNLKIEPIKSIEVTDDMDTFKQLKEFAENNEMFILSIKDSKNLYQKLMNSVKNPRDKEKVIEQISKKARVYCTVKYVNNSVFTTIDDIEQKMEEINSIINQQSLKQT